MRVEKRVNFQEVLDEFTRHNDVARNQWALDAIKVADKELDHWVRAILDFDDILNIMLPYHNHRAYLLVPQSGSTVSEAIEKLKSLPPEGCCPNKIDYFSNKPSSLIFLSMKPISHGDYAGLVARGYEGLTHLDGLHRLVAWGRSGISEVAAYVAGRTRPATNSS